MAICSLPTLSCTTHFVEDAPNIWATKESAQNRRLFSIAIWYSPGNNCALTMAEIVQVIEDDIGIRVGELTVRGVVIPRGHHGNHMAADLLRDKEVFTIQCLPLCCTIL